MSDQRIVHIGFPKTGTTFLQKEVFPQFDGLNYIDYRSCEQVFTDLIYLDDLDYESDSASTRLEKHLKKGPNLFSFEALAGAPFIYKGLGRSRIPLRLKKLGFSKVIISIRDQVKMYDSLYRQYIVQGGVMRFKDFLNSDGKWNLYVRAFNPDYLKYDRLISKYQEVFGAENVMIIDYHEIAKNKNRVFAKLEKFMNCPLAQVNEGRKVNSSLCNLSVSVLRIMNHFIFTSQKPNNLISNHISTRNVSRIFLAILDPYFFRFFSSRKSLVTQSQYEYIRDYYQKSNVALEQLTGISIMPRKPE